MRFKKQSEEPSYYDLAVKEYNFAFTRLNEAGVELMTLRKRSLDTLFFVECLVNSIANTPKSFKTDIEKIKLKKKEFKATEEFAKEEIAIAKKTAASAKVGATAGIAIAGLAPSAVMWVATTFGTASTGTAISTLSGAAATNAALAWIGGGSLAAGGGGMAGGSALLVLAGPVGASVAAISIFSSIVLFRSKKNKLDKEMQEALHVIKRNANSLKMMKSKVQNLHEITEPIHSALMEEFIESAHLMGEDYLNLDGEEKIKLGTLVNRAKTLAYVLNRKIVDEKA